MVSTTLYPSEGIEVVNFYSLLVLSALTAISHSFSCVALKSPCGNEDVGKIDPPIRSRHSDLGNLVGLLFGKVVFYLYTNKSQECTFSLSSSWGKFVLCILSIHDPWRPTLYSTQWAHSDQTHWPIAMGRTWEINVPLSLSTFSLLLGIGGLPVTSLSP